VNPKPSRSSALPPIGHRKSDPLINGRSSAVREEGGGCAQTLSDTDVVSMIAETRMTTGRVMISVAVDN
jgi:hypothetical protein